MLKYYSIALDDRPPITGDHVDTLLKSLLKAGEPVTYGCGAGNCGACRYVLAQGEVDQKNDSILSESQRQAGEILACQCRPLSDLVLRSPARQQGDPVTLSGQITRVERPTADLVKLRIKLESLLDFEPGQYGLLKTLMDRPGRIPLPVPVASRWWSFTFARSPGAKPDRRCTKTPTEVIRSN